MLKSKKKIVPIEKRGGARRPARGKPKSTAQQLAPTDYYKDKGKGIFPKRLGQYRLVICTDLEPDDIAALVMLTAWIKVNEAFFDARNNFPIYGFVLGETHNKRVKAQRAREFLHCVAEILAWDDPEHHLCKGYQQAGRNVWFDGESDLRFDNEKELVSHEEALEDEGYPDPTPFVTSIDELMVVKASNLFFLYLKPLRFFQSLKDRPAVLEYLRQAPGAICGSWNVHSVLSESPELKEPILRFLNRTKNDAPLLYADSTHALGTDDSIDVDQCPKLFNQLDDAEEDELAYLLSKVMYCWNDNLLNQLQDIPEFEDTDLDDYNSFVGDRDKLSTERTEQLKDILKTVDNVIRHNSRQLAYREPLAIIALLMATGTLINTPFRLQPARIGWDQEASVEADASSNTHVLLAKGEISASHVKTAKRLLENMLSAAFAVTSEVR